MLATFSGFGNTYFPCLYALYKLDAYQISCVRLRVKPILPNYIHTYGVPVLTISSYSERWSSANFKACCNSLCHSSGVWFILANMRSIFTFPGKTFFATSSACSPSRDVWSRPSAVSALSLRDCNPRESRFTPTDRKFERDSVSTGCKTS